MEHVRYTVGEKRNYVIIKIKQIIRAVQVSTFTFRQRAARASTLITKKHSQKRRKSRETKEAIDKRHNNKCCTNRAENEGNAGDRTQPFCFALPTHHTPQIDAFSSTIQDAPVMSRFKLLVGLHFASKKTTNGLDDTVRFYFAHTR